MLAPCSPTSQRNLRKEAEARGVDPKRIIFSAKLPHSIHLARQRLADLALDTLHHGGGVTTVDALNVVLTDSQPTPNTTGALAGAATGTLDINAGVSNGTVFGGVAFLFSVARAAAAGVILVAA